MHRITYVSLRVHKQQHIELKVTLRYNLTIHQMQRKMNKLINKFQSTVRKSLLMICGSSDILIVKQNPKTILNHEIIEEND